MDKYIYMYIYVYIYIYIILKFMFWGHMKTAQTDHHVTILFFLFAYVECNFVVAKYNLI